MRRLTGLAVVALVVVSGCDGPTSPPGGPDDGGGVSAASILTGVYNTQAIVTCNVTIAPNSVQCTSPQDLNPAVAPVFGGRGMHVRLRANSIVYKADSTRLRFRMTVQNLLPQAIGSSKGPFTGMKVFLTEPVTTTGGTGVVTPQNADGVDEFTAPGQPFWNFTKTLVMGATSPLEHVFFNVPPTVTSFRFRAYVSAEIMPLIVFDMEQAGNRDIYAVNMDGTGLRRLTTNDGVDAMPVVARDRVVFVSYRDGNAELYAMSLVNAPAETRLTNTPWNETEPTLNGDNTLLTWVSDQTGMPRIVVANQNANGIVPLPPFGLSSSVEASPSFIAGGTEVVYMSTGDVRPDLYRASRVDGIVRRLITSKSMRMEPRANPEGTRVMFVSAPSVDGIDTNVWMLDVAQATTIRISGNDNPDKQPTFLHNDRVAWLYGTTPTTFVLRTATLTGTDGRTTPLPAEPAHPYGVPLRQ